MPNNNKNNEETHEKEVIIHNPMVKYLVGEFPRWQEHVKAQEEKKKNEMEFAEQVFGKAVDELLEGNSFLARMYKHRISELEKKRK